MCVFCFSLVFGSHIFKLAISMSCVHTSVHGTLLVYLCCFVSGQDLTFIFVCVFSIIFRFLVFVWFC